MASCLIVGGGFLGAHVAHRLASAGNDVTVYSRSFSEWLVREDRSGTGEITLVEGALPPGDGLQELAEAADAVFYFAGTSTPAMANADPGGSIALSVIPAAALFDLMLPTSTRRVVIASSGGTVYGPAQELPTPETHPTRPISLHGHNSLTIERYARFFAEQHGFSPIILRFSNPYGPGQLARRGQGVIAAWCEALVRNEPLIVFGDTSTTRDFVFVEDAAAAVEVASTVEAPGTFNVGGGRSLSLEEVLELIQRVAGRTAEIIRKPGRRVDVPQNELDLRRLREHTGWEPTTSIEEGLRVTWAWVRELPYERRG